MIFPHIEHIKLITLIKLTMEEIKYILPSQSESCKHLICISNWCNVALTGKMSLTFCVCVSRLLSSLTFLSTLLVIKIWKQSQNFHQSKINSILFRFTEYTMSEINATAISGLGGLVVMMLARIAKDWGLIPHWDIKNFGMANYHLWDPLLHLVANMIPEPEIHGGVNVTAISVLGGLVVMMLFQTMRDWGLIPHWGTAFFWIMSLIWPTVTLF